MPIPSAVQGFVLIGAGPAGLAPLFAAASAGRLDELLQIGVTILEANDEPGSGQLGSYAISSDSSADAFLDIVIRSEEPKLLALRTHPATRALVALGKTAAPLTIVSAFLAVAGKAMCEIVQQSPHGQVFTGAVALSVQQTSSGWRTNFRLTASEREYALESRCVLIATGAQQRRDDLLKQQVAGVRLERFADKLIQSGEVLAHGGITRVEERLRHLATPSIAIIGGSTSAGAVAACLLREASLSLAEGGLTILHQRPLRIFYESVDAAITENYREFQPDDICSLTGRVFRFSGFRLESRELIMRARRIGGRVPEPRLALLQLCAENEREALLKLETADLIVAALGYRPKGLPILDEQGRNQLVLSPAQGMWSIVDERCRLLRCDGMAFPGLFAMGLAVGPSPDPALGGEANFHGQVNSLWMWQNVLGLRIVDEICSQRDRVSVRRASASTYLQPSRASYNQPAAASAVAGFGGVK